MRALAIGIVMAAAAVSARPLPRGMAVSVKNDRLWVTVDGTTVPLDDDAYAAAHPVSQLDGVELSADGTALVIHAPDCMGDSDPDGRQVALDAITATVENMRGMQLHLKKKYADAIPHFAAAAKASQQYATNLLCAQSMAGRLDDADKTVATFSPGHAVWFGWRLAVDPELAAMRGRASVRALLAARPSKLTADAMGDAIAVSPLGLVAIREWTFFGGPGAAGGSDILLYDIKTGDMVLRVTLVDIGDDCDASGKPPANDVAGLPPCSKDVRARTAAHRRSVDPMLAAFAFEKRPTVWVDLVGNDADTVTTPDKKQSLTFTKNGVTLARNGKTRAATLDGQGKLIRVGFAGDYVIVQSRENGFSGCSGDAQRSYSQVLVAP
ncbi:MAG TPA: hypothetical protein VLX92_15920 [Kofleriaceae bacterium]|nr:hypothetical protein [Kofleriaceae bacterium]